MGAFGLHLLLVTPLSDVNSSICTTLSELLDKKTSNFHSSVSEITIMLNHVSCLLHKLIHGKLDDHHAKISQEQGAYLITDLHGVDPDYATTERDKMKDGHMSCVCVCAREPLRDLNTFNEWFWGNTIPYYM